MSLMQREGVQPMAREKLVKEFYFDKDKDWRKEVAKLESEGWRNIAGESIEQIMVKTLGIRLTFERRRNATE